MNSVDSIQFGILNHEEIKKLSVVEVNAHEIFEKGIPKPNSLGDLRMGTIERQYICQTCNQNSIHCPGHFGHIELAEPVYHILYIKQLVKVLQSICLNCYNLVSPVGKLSVKNSFNFKNTNEICKSKTKCYHCDTPKSKFILEKYEIFSEIDGSKNKINAYEIYDILTKLSPDVLKSLGFDKNHSHPKDFFR